MNINPAYRLHELEETLRAADVATLIVGAPFKGSDFVGMVETVCPEVAAAGSPDWSVGEAARLRRLVAVGDRPGPGWLTWADLEAGRRRRRSWRRASDGQARRRLQHPVHLGHDRPAQGGDAHAPERADERLLHRPSGCATRPSDRVCVPVPFYHCFGCVLGTLVCAVYGSAMVVPAPSFDPGATLAAVAAERCTSLYGVPTMFVAELDHPDRGRFDLSSLRTGIMAGQPVPAAADGGGRSRRWGPARSRSATGRPRRRRSSP